MYERSEIGVYSQHVCYPKNAKFSVVLLHDMLQDYIHWPNLWEVEPWGDFDLGILPGDSWAERWQRCGALYYANPRHGIYSLGYPKCDDLYSQEHRDNVNRLRGSLGLRYDRSILYAPSWETEGKEDDFITALASLPVNLLVKHVHWPPSYAFVIRNIEEMHALHEGKYENLYYIDAEESIMTVLDLCDIIVSDESNVLLEGLLFGKPGIAVTDWHIPDCTPPRLASFPEEYAVHCEKALLRDYIEKILSRELDCSEYIRRGASLFGPGGSVCSDIMDAIDYFTGYGEKTDFLQKKLRPRLLPFD
jgi:CDP-glycerol glycerophosphotransferase (TagB/SpsB family)